MTRTPRLSRLRSAALGVLASAALILSGCAGGADERSPGTGLETDDGPVPPAPEFSGPYAADYEAAWRESTSDFVRSALADEQVTDQEWAEVATRMESCLAEAGLDFLGYEPDGSYGVGPSAHDGDRLNEEILPACELASGDVPLTRLRDDAITNPQNLDTSEILIDCLEESGIIERGYDRRDFERDYAAQSFPWVDPASGPEEFWRCHDDPLGLRSGGE